MDVVFEGRLSRFSVRKVERKDILGYVKRVGFDADGQECPTALLTEDGFQILANGCTAEMYVSGSGDVVEKKELVACDEAGHRLPELAPTGEESQELLGPISPSEFLSHVARSQYIIYREDLFAPELARALDAGEIFRVPFRPRKTYQDRPAFLLKGMDGYILVVTEACRYEFSYPGEMALLLEDEEFDDADGEDAFDLGDATWGGML